MSLDLQFPTYAPQPMAFREDEEEKRRDATWLVNLNNNHHTHILTVGGGGEGAEEEGPVLCVPLNISSYPKCVQGLEEEERRSSCSTFRGPSSSTPPQPPPLSITSNVLVSSIRSSSTHRIQFLTKHFVTVSVLRVLSTAGGSWLRL